MVKPPVVIAVVIGRPGGARSDPAPRTRTRASKGPSAGCAFWLTDRGPARCRATSPDIRLKLEEVLSDDAA